MEAARRSGRKPKLNDIDKEALVKGLLEGPERLGYATPLWTCDRVVHLIKEQFGIAYLQGMFGKCFDN